MIVDLKCGKNKVERIFVSDVDEEEKIKARMEKLKKRHICTDCYATICKNEGTTVEKERVTKGVAILEQQGNGNIKQICAAIIGCENFYVLKHPVKEVPAQPISDELQEQMDMERYGVEVEIPDPKVKKIFRDMK